MQTIKFNCTESTRDYLEIEQSAENKDLWFETTTTCENSNRLC